MERPLLVRSGLHLNKVVFIRTQFTLTCMMWFSLEYCGLTWIWSKTCNLEEGAPVFHCDCRDFSFMAELHLKLNELVITCRNWSLELEQSCLEWRGLYLYDLVFIR